MEVIQENSESGGRFLAFEQGEEAGKIIYTLKEKSVLVIQHTIVYPKFKGKNVGTLLVLQVAHFAEKEHLKIIPVCSFAKSVFKRRQEIQYLLF